MNSREIIKYATIHLIEAREYEVTISAPEQQAVQSSD